MLYVIAITLSLLAGFACGALFWRKHAERLKATEAEGRKFIDSLKNE